MPKALARSRSPRTPSRRSSSPTSPVMVTIFIQHALYPNLSVSCHPSATIGDVKDNISSKIDISTCEIFLFRRNEPLDDNASLDSVCSDILQVGFDILELDLRFDVTVKSLAGESIIINVSEQDTIGILMSKLEDALQIPYNEQSLIVQGEKQPGWFTLEMAGITSSSAKASIEIILVRQEIEFPLRIVFEDCIMRGVWLDARGSDTIEDIKVKIQEKTQIKLSDQFLTLKTLPLENEKTVAHYGISNDTDYLSLHFIPDDSDSD